MPASPPRTWWSGSWPPKSKTRHDLGREKFIERVWAWRAEKGGTIINQLKRMGASCDWDRERFTMDEGLSLAVREVFVRLYKEGLIYKGDYIVNWCPRCHTALADDEVEHDPTDGKLYHIRYPYADGSGSVVVATTRPETMLGDTAVAVHPGRRTLRSTCRPSASSCRSPTGPSRWYSITMSSANSAPAR